MARLPIQPAAPRGLAIPVWSYDAVDSAAEWERGAVVVDDGGGELTEGGADPTLIAGIAVAKHPPTNEYATDIGKFIPALPGLQFEGSVDDSGDLGNGASAATDRGLTYGLTQDSAGIWYVDKGKAVGDDAAAVRVRITKLIDAAGTTQGRVRFVFLGAVDLAGGSTGPLSPTLWAGE